MSEAYRRALDSQALASDPNLSVFVTANAGSGKTKVLIDRVARLLLAGGPPSHFLCITFTKAAAAEMQRRLFERLGAWCVAPDDELALQLSALEEGAAVTPERLGRARALFARALETPGGLKIQTIHAFCERLLARFPAEAGLAPGFRVLDEERSAALARQAFALSSRAPALAGALDRLGARFDGESFEALVRAALGQRAALAPFAAAPQSVSRRHGDPPSCEALVQTALAHAPWEDLRHAAMRLRQRGQRDCAAAARIEAALSRRDFETYRDVFFKADGDPHRASPTDGARTSEPFIGALFADETARLDAIMESMRASERAADARALLEIFAACRDAFAAAKTRESALDFDDLIERSAALLTRSEAAPWILYKLDGGVDHILIDEGQDTSPTQWDLIEPLQREFFAGEGARRLNRTVFAVGDHKQSIYSFQGADPARFLREAQGLSSRAAAAEKPFAGPVLEMSFRSAPEILAAVDATFAESPLHEGLLSDVVRHDAYRAKDVGRVEWWPLAPRPAVVEAVPWDAPMDSEPSASAASDLARALAARIAQGIREGEGVYEKGALRPMRPGDVLVLVRSRGPLFAQLIRAFKRERLPVAGADRLRLKDEIAVQDILCAARAALDPSDDLSFAALLKSPLVGLVDDDRDLFPLAFARARGERLIDRVLETEEPRLAEARALAGWLMESAHLHPHAFVRRLLDWLDESGRSGWTRMAARLGLACRDPLEELCERALTMGRDGLATLQRFVWLVENDASEIKRETESGTDVVRIMTVHGAKGLEAPVVALPDTTAGPSRDKSAALLVTDEGPLVRVAKSDEDQAARRMRESAEEAAARENLRLLYVAMTRARDRLIVCGAFRGNESGDGAESGAWSPLVRNGLERAGATPCDTPFGEGLALGAVHVARAANAPAPQPEASLPAWARSAPVGESRAVALAPSRAGVPHLSPRAREARARGRVLHGLLQRLPAIAPLDRRGYALQWLAIAGIDEAKREALASEALAVAEEPSFAAVFGPDSRAECPIVATLANGRVVNGVLDRLVLTPGEALAIDFKTDRPAPALEDDIPSRILRQMALYREALAAIFPARAPRLAIVWTAAPRITPLSNAALDRALREDAAD